MCFSAIFKNYTVLSSSSFLVLVGIMKLFIQFASTLLYKSSQKILFIILWNVSSELHNLKYITFSLNSSLFIKSTSHLTQGHHVYTIYPDVIFQILLPYSRPMTSYHVTCHVTSISCVSSSSKEKRNSKEKKYKIKKNR